MCWPSWLWGKFSDIQGWTWRNSKMWKKLCKFVWHRLSLFSFCVCVISRFKIDCLQLLQFDEQVAEITFNLWYRLSEELYQRNDENLTLIFKPYVERLIESLCRHSRMEPDHVSSFYISFRSFLRWQVNDYLKFSGRTVGRSWWLCGFSNQSIWTYQRCCLYRRVF